MAMHETDIQDDDDARALAIKLTVQPSMGSVFEYIASLPPRARARESLHLMRKGFEMQSGMIQQMGHQVAFPAAIPERARPHANNKQVPVERVDPTGLDRVAEVYGSGASLVDFLEPVFS